MKKHSINIELDDETLRDLAVLGEPIEVLARLAHSVADGVRGPGRSARDRTDHSLQNERDKSDVAIAQERENVENRADEVMRVARERADVIVQTARDDADDGVSQSAGTKSTSARDRADGILHDERSSADAVLASERSVQSRHSNGFLAVERDTLDKDLSGERGHSDTLLVDQREANAHMVNATIRAQELTEIADDAKKRAEHSEQQLREVAEFRERFIGILGHDLRTPLGAILMSTGLLLQRGRLDAQDAATVARIIRSSQRMTGMITQLLDLTRARLGGGLPLELAPTDLSAVCRDVIEEFEAPIELQIEGDVTGNWDPERLSEVLSNLAGNAIEYSAPGTAVIVKARADGADVVVEVINQGDPIPADVLPHIFDPFRRAQPKAKSKPGNLGLGLFIADQIVRSHGGTLDCHSANGTTTFAMRLPRAHPAS